MNSAQDQSGHLSAVVFRVLRQWTW